MKMADMLDMHGRVVAITGGYGHIASVMEDSLAELGASIVVVGRDEDKCKARASQLTDVWGVETLAISADFEEQEQVAAIPELIRKHFVRLDVLINCAAFVGTSKLNGWNTPFLEQDIDVWRRALEVNLTVPFFLAQRCCDLLRESGHGSIINVGSIYGHVGPDLSIYAGTGINNPAAYAASKGGLAQLTRWLSTVLAPDVRVNAIIPGGIYRGQNEDFVKRYVARTPMGRMGHEEDMQGAAVYLASDMSSYVTGQCLFVDGGWSVW